MTGLAWFDPDDMAHPLSLRHDAQQGDKLTKYGWRKHDGRLYGWQEVVDGDYVMNVTMVGGRVTVRAGDGAGHPAGWNP
jgi:mannosyl-oligosaccharide glucosidase